jgi:adenine/guanine phosphoribosyltransferase-like PRPP-binding protein
MDSTCICCSEDLPEITRSWAELFQEYKGNAVLTAKVMGIPLTAFAASMVFNYVIRKKSL